MYRLTVNDAETYMVVMRNVFSPRLTIHKKYDLKVGSEQSFPGDLLEAKLWVCGLISVMVDNFWRSCIRVLQM